MLSSTPWHEKRFRQALSVLGDNVWEFDFQSGHTYFSENIFGFIGYTAEELDADEDLWKKCIHAEDLAMVETIARHYLEGKITQHEMEYRIFHKNGSLKWVMDRGVVIDYDEKGMPLRIIGTQTDISERKRSEQVMAENERRFRDLTQNVPGVIYEWHEYADGTFKFNYVSPRIREFFGLEPDGMDKVVEYIHPEDRERWRTSIEEANANETPWFFEGRLLYPDGSIKWWQGASVLSFKSETTKVYNGIMIDITQNRKLEQVAKEKEEQINLFVKHTPAAIAMFDHELKYLIASDRWYSDYGLVGQKIIGRSHYDVFPEINDIPEWKEHHRLCLAGASIKKEMDHFKRQDGTIDWLSYEIHPWRKSNGEIGGLIMFTEVINDRVKAQRELESLNNQLGSSNKELEQFAYVASHDLQEPLRMVSSFLQLLQKKYAANLDETANKYIHFAVDGSNRMKKLINDLLQFSRVGTQSGEMEGVDLNRIVQQSVAGFQADLDEMGGQVVLEPLPSIMGNAVQLEQLFRNLISNALKYKSERPLAVRIGAMEEEERWIFFVEDNGIGIDEKYFEKIFIIFQRLHNRNEFSGTGIGLALCKKIVERHGGSIWVRSKPGEGSVFYFSVAKTL